MPTDEKPAVPKAILDLVERFERNREAYKSGHYNETQVRREFLDPFFKALGWDIDNEQGYAEDYKDVFHEDAIKTTDGTKAPDYCFRIGGARKFFLEAKRPSVDIKNDVSPALQLRRYGWTTKLPLSVLSDFEEFAVYDCRFKPDKKDSAAVGRILYIHYTEYATRWHEIAAVFSREAVLKGSFDKFAESSKAKRGTADVDDAFLETIETWRKELAQNLALRNKELSQRELNFAVQRIIDRIIFLRICEGRGIEDYGRLRALTDGDKIYPRLGKLFEQADDRYNSGLFHFRGEKGRHEAPDELTLKLDLDDKLLRDILKNLYYPDSPYCRRMCWGRSMSNSSAKSSGSRPPTAPKWTTSRMSKRPAASFTRPPTSANTSSKTPWANCWMKLSRRSVTAEKPATTQMAVPDRRYS
jgi:hypothetical protein